METPVFMPFALLMNCNKQKKTALENGLSSILKIIFISERPPILQVK
jgi:hypothetical protein